MDKNKWHMRAFCLECGWSTKVDRREFASDFFDYCPNCGSELSNFIDRVVRWVSTSVWYKPRTWFTGEWMDTNSNTYISIE